MIVGVLSLQGDFAEHKAALESSGMQTAMVKSVEQLKNIDALIMPGGESTTIGKLLSMTGLDEAIREAARNGLKIWGTCAGAILLANEVITDKPVNNLGLIDVTIERNGYGSQKESFEAKLEVDEIELEAAFIRAPIIKEVGGDAEVLISYNGNPVMVRQGNILVSSFHPELYGNPQFYKWLQEWINNN